VVVTYTLFVVIIQNPFLFLNSLLVYTILLGTKIKGKTKKS